MVAPQPTNPDSKPASEPTSVGTGGAPLLESHRAGRTPVVRVGSRSSRSGRLAVVGLCGIISGVLGVMLAPLLGMLGVALGILALVLGSAARAHMQPRREGRWVATSAIVLGIGAIGIGIITFVVEVGCLAWVIQARCWRVRGQL